MLCGLTSWATCGTGKPRENKKTGNANKEANPHIDRYERLKLPREQREEIGKRTKRLLDQGRMEYIRNTLNIPSVKLAYYVDTSYTLENVVLIANN